MLPNEKHELSAGWRAAQKSGPAGCTQDWPVGCTLREASGLHIKLGCGKGQSGGLLFSAACPALFRSPSHRLFVQPIGPPFWLVFCAARQPADSSRFSFGNMALQPARPAGPPISVIRNPLTKLYALLWMRLQSKFHLCVYTV